MSLLLHLAVGLLLASSGRTENSTTPGDTCELGGPGELGPWGAALEDWATATPTRERQGRIMVLPQAQGYYVTDRIDGPLLAPPPPPLQQHPPRHPQQQQPHPPPGGRYEEWQATPPPPPGAGKIVNRPPNPYKDKFKPSYPAPSPNQPIPVHGPPPSPVYHGQPTVDRVDESRPAPPQKQVSETDLFLLGAIEKLVYRVDLMEKRLRKMEENVHYLVAGVDAKPEPCASNFTRAGAGCYHFSSDAANWKGASYACRKLKANMLEIDDDDEKRHLTSAVLAEKRLKGGEFWTGGLNPGLLWIWSHSARPVLANGTQSAAIAGEGRCLAWLHDAPGASYVFRGQDCALRHRYICEKEEDKTKLSNEIERAARRLRENPRAARVLWDEEEHHRL